MIVLGEFTDVLYCQWATEAQDTVMYIIRDGNNINTVTQGGYPWWDDIFTCGAFIRPWQPAPYYVWEGIEDGEGEWEIDYELFNPMMFDALKMHRDDSINGESVVTLTFDDGGEDEEVLRLHPNARTMEAVGRKTVVAPIVNNESTTVNYKFSSFTSFGVTDRGYREVNTGFLQDFYKALDASNQKNFDAEKFVLETHDGTPYTSIEAALVAFDIYLAS